MAKNCWEHKKCGREVGGAKADELGVCPAANSQQFNNKNNGTNGGRFCWKVAGTLCGGDVQGSFAQKLTNCKTCDFFEEVRSDQGRKFRLI